MHLRFKWYILIFLNNLAGGDFDYLKRAYGDTAAFSFAWYNFWISKPGSQAIIATIFGQYCVAAFTGKDIRNGSSDELWVAKMLAVILLFTLTLVNCAGVRESANLQNFLTCAKVFMVIFIVISPDYSYLLHL